MKKTIVILGHYPVSELLNEGKVAQSGSHPTWLCQFADSLAGHTKEFEIHWIVMHKGEASEVTHLGQTFHCLKRWKHTFQLVTGYYFERKKIQKIIDAIKPDVVHAWGTEDVYALAATHSRIPSIVSMQGILNVYKHVAGASLFLKIQSYYEASALKRATLLTVESEWGRRKLTKLFPESKIKCIEYGIDPAYYDTDWTPRSQPVALFIGSINRAKGTDVLIKAFADVRLSGMKLKMIGFGLASYVDELKQQASKNVEFLGPLDRESVRSELSQAWCLVLPTMCDTSPNVVKEARVVGLPVITSPHGGQADYIQDRVNGRIVDPLIESDLSDAMYELLSDIDKCKEYGENKKNEARNKFMPTGTADSMIAAYRLY